VHLYYYYYYFVLAIIKFLYTEAHSSPLCRAFRKTFLYLPYIVLCVCREASAEDRRTLIFAQPFIARIWDFCKGFTLTVCVYPNKSRGARWPLLLVTHRIKAFPQVFYGYLTLLYVIYNTTIQLSVCLNRLFFSLFVLKLYIYIIHSWFVPLTFLNMYKM